MEALEIVDSSLAREQKSGTVTVFTGIEYPGSWKKEFEVLLPQPGDCKLALNLSSELYDARKPVPPVNVLIASKALNRGVPVATRERHFLVIRGVEKQLEVKFVPWRSAPRSQLGGFAPLFRFPQ